ncbi:type II toxin-antitoxin system YafQ family toxin [Bifidobacterium thermacidophilum]|uniref:Type II toxin-antitoxin system YafQ family toxin n=1 Tax=Bifidobacterium thermacidophilum TaxID=246618 RepID=A0ABW8KM04_9BIFI
MPLTVKFTSAFKRSYKLMRKRGLDLDLLDETINLLRNHKSLPEQYRDHALTGKLKGFRECHIQPDWLLIYLIDDDILTLTLVDTGSHADLFNL